MPHLGDTNPVIWNNHPGRCPGQVRHQCARSHAWSKPRTNVYQRNYERIWSPVILPRVALTPQNASGIRPCSCHELWSCRRWRSMTKSVQFLPSIDC